MSIIARRFHDRAGNQLFQYMHARAYAERVGAELQTDPWWGQRVFGLTEKRIGKELPLRADMAFETWDGEKDIEISGWCLHQKCLLYSREDAKRWLRFTEEIARLLAFVPHDEVACHLRWGDFQTDPKFIAVSHASYEQAVARFVPDFTGRPVLVCAWEPLRSTKLDYLDLGWLPDFVRMMRGRHLFRANSTFSWWAAVLGEAERVFAPQLNGIAPLAGCFQNVPFVAGNWPAISCVHPNCSDLHLRET